MKLQLLSLAFAILTTTELHAQEQKTQGDASLTVIVNGASSSNGVIRVALYNNASDYLEKDVAALTTPALKQGASVTFTKLPKGTYALAVLHDENNNGKMDKILGIPEEAYGFSKVRPNLRPARFQEASFEVDRTQNTQTVNIK